MKNDTKTAHTTPAHAARRTTPHAAELLPADAVPVPPAPAAVPPPAPEPLGASATVTPSVPPASAVAPVTPATPGPSILTMLIAQATQSVQAAMAALAQVLFCLPGLISLPDAQRKTIGGRFRDGEAQVLIGVLQECAARPELVASLADEDNGVDPNTFETTLLISRIQLALILAPVSASLAQLASNVDDTVLYLNQLTREPTLAAYAILKAVAKTDLSVKTAITPALDFYANIAKNAAAARKKNAAAKAAAQATPVAPVAAPPALVPAGATGTASVTTGK